MDILKGVGTSAKMMIATCFISIPLALWKLIEIIILIFY